MRKKHLYILVAFLALILILSLFLLVVGIFMPNEKGGAFGGLGELFSGFPDVSSENFSILARFDDFTMSFNLGLRKPFFALDQGAAGTVFHISLWLAFALIGGMAASCFIEEVSAGTSLVVAILEFILCPKVIAHLRSQVDSGADSWEVAIGAFWLLVFIYSLLIFNGMIGIGSKLLRGIFVTEGAKVIMTFVVSGILSNAVACVIAAIAYLLVGLGFFGGITLCLVITFLFVAFCEVMDYVVE